MGRLDRFGKLEADPSESEAGCPMVPFKARVANWSGRAYWNQRLLSPLPRMNTNTNVKPVVQAPFARGPIIPLGTEGRLCLTD